MDHILKLRNGFLCLLILFALFMIYKMRPRISFINPIKMQLIKQKGNIKRLADPQNIDFEVNYRIPTVDFVEGTELYHKKLGPLGFQNDFFLDITSKFIVLKEGNYEFSIASDDGFQFWVNDNLIGEFLDNRSLATNQFSLYLKPGDYSFRIYYYQGYGRMGLYAGYKYTGDNRYYIVGENSPFMRFHEK